MVNVCWIINSCQNHERQMKGTRSEGLEREPCRKLSPFFICHDKNFAWSNVPDLCFTCPLSQCQNIYQCRPQNLDWKLRHSYWILVSVEIPICTCLDKQPCSSCVYWVVDLKIVFRNFPNLPLETSPPRLLWWSQSIMRRAAIIQKCIVDVMVALFSEKTHLKGISDVQTGSLLLQPFDA